MFIDRRIPLGLRGEYVDVGDPIAYFWETPGEFREAVRFLKVGFERGEFCVIFGHTEGNRRVCESLAECGYDCARLEGLGRLVIVPGQANAAQMLSPIRHVFTEALECGATLIRLLGNIGWGSRQVCDSPSGPGGILALQSDRRCSMRYVMAWLLGVPFSVIVLWYIVGHAACR